MYVQRGQRALPFCGCWFQHQDLLTTTISNCQFQPGNLLSSCHNLPSFLAELAAAFPSKSPTTWCLPLAQERLVIPLPSAVAHTNLLSSAGLFCRRFEERAWSSRHPAKHSACFEDWGFVNRSLPTNSFRKVGFLQKVGRSCQPQPRGQ